MRIVLWGSSSYRTSKSGDGVLEPGIGSECVTPSMSHLPFWERGWVLERDGLRGGVVHVFCSTTRGRLMTASYSVLIWW